MAQNKQKNPVKGLENIQIAVDPVTIRENTAKEISNFVGAVDVDAIIEKAEAEKAEAEKIKADYAAYLPQARELGKKIREVERKLKGLGLGETEINKKLQPMAEKLEEIKLSLPVDQHMMLEKRLSFDSLVEEIDEAKKLAERSIYPFKSLERMVLKGEKIKYLKRGTAESGSRISLQIGGQMVTFLPEKEGKMATELIRKLHDLRRLCAERHKATADQRKEIYTARKENEKKRAETVEKLKSTAGDVLTIIEDGNSGHVAGFFSWRDRNGQERQEFLEVQATEGVATVIDGSRNFSNFVGKTFQTKDPNLTDGRWRFLYAALKQLSRELQKNSAVATAPTATAPKKKFSGKKYISH